MWDVTGTIVGCAGHHKAVTKIKFRAVPASDTATPAGSAGVSGRASAPADLGSGLLPRVARPPPWAIESGEVAGVLWRTSPGLTVFP